MNCHTIERLTKCLMLWSMQYFCENITFLVVTWNVLQLEMTSVTLLAKVMRTHTEMAASTQVNLGQPTRVAVLHRLHARTRRPSASALACWAYGCLRLSPRPPRGHASSRRLVVVVCSVWFRLFYMYMVDMKINLWMNSPLFIQKVHMGHTRVSERPKNKIINITRWGWSNSREAIDKWWLTTS